MTRRQGTRQQDRPGEPSLPVEDYSNLVTDHLSDVVLVLAADDRILWVCPAVRATLGWEPNDLVGMSMRDLVHPEDVKYVLAGRKATGIGVLPAGELRHRHRDGSYIWLSSRAQAVTDDRGVLVKRVVSLRDMESVVDSRWNLSTSEARYRMFVDNSSDMVYEADTKGVIQWVSPSVERLLGWKPEDLVGRRVQDLPVTERSRPALTSYAKRVRAGVAGAEVEMCCPDGSHRWLAVSSRPIKRGNGLKERTVGSLRDVQVEVTERRARSVLEAGLAVLLRAEQETQLLAEMCQAAVDSAGYLFAWYGRRIEDDEHSVEKVASSSQFSDFLDEIPVTWAAERPEGQGAAGPAIRTGRTAIVDDIARHVTVKSWLKATDARGFRSVVSLPVVVRGRVDGAFTVYAGEVAAFDDKGVILLEELASELGIGLGRLRDADERRLIEKEVRQTKALFEAIVESTEDMIWTVEPERYDLVFANRNFQEYSRTGRNIELRPGMTFEERIPDPEYQRIWRSAYAEARDKGHCELTDYVTQANDYRVHITINALRNEGQIFGYSVFAKNVTQRRLAEAQIASYAKQLESAMEETLQAVSNMAELRDLYTAGHERRVGQFASDIARHLGWAEDRCHNLYLAGLVHDIGKISTPAEILSKPSRLTPAEYMVVQAHVDMGYGILKKVSFLQDLAEIIRQHHERMDGSGYPQKLNGDEILPEARILAVADVVESMSSHRPYRPALGIEVALKELEDNRARLYDEDVVDAVTAMVRLQGYTLE